MRERVKQHATNPMIVATISALALTIALAVAFATLASNYASTEDLKQAQAHTNVLLAAQSKINCATLIELRDAAIEVLAGAENTTTTASSYSRAEQRSLREFYDQQISSLKKVECRPTYKSPAPTR
jgi:cell division protein FtsX